MRLSHENREGYKLRDSFGVRWSERGTVVLKCRCRKERARNQQPRSSGHSLVDDTIDSEVLPK